MNTPLKHTIVFALIVIQTIFTQAVAHQQLPNIPLQYFDQQRPDNISDDKWFALKAAAQDIKLLPTPNGIGALESHFGQSVSLEGNRALIGAPNFHGKGAAYVFDYNGTQWQQTAVLMSITLRPLRHTINVV